MAQYLLALYRDYAVPIPPERSQQVWAGVGELGGALIGPGRLLGAAVGGGGSVDGRA